MIWFDLIKNTDGFVIYNSYIDMYKEICFTHLAKLQLHKTQNKTFVVLLIQRKYRRRQPFWFILVSL